MKNLSLSIFLSITVISIYAQQDNQLIIGSIDSIQSTILNEQRELWVHIPQEFQNPIFGAKKFPVVYVLDGDDHFYSVVSMMQQLSSIAGNNLCPPMIVVGIPNTNRTRDLTPTTSDVILTFDTASNNTGGGENFISFLEKELIPYIDSKYPTASYRMLIGHSLGGLTAMNILTHHTKLFNAYVAIDPSMWWDNEKLLTDFSDAFTTNKFTGISLYHAFANTMPPGMTFEKAKKDDTKGTDLIRSNLKLKEWLTQHKTTSLNSYSKYYNEDDHNSVPFIAEYDAFRFIFNFYKLKLTPLELSYCNQTVISKIEKHYQRVSAQMGYKIPIPEELANNLGYQNMAVLLMNEAEYLFKLNVSNYPESPNVYDSLGDLYITKGEKSKAKENYKKALSLKEIPETRQKLELLLK